MIDTDNVRALAADCIHQLFLDRGSLGQLLPTYQESASVWDKSLLQELVYGTCRRFHQLDGAARQLLTSPLRKRDQLVKCLLLVGMYQIAYMRTPNHAAINETVDASRELGLPRATGLINGILRRFSEDPQTQLADLDSPPIRLSHPEWMVAKLQHNWPEHWESILDANNQHPPMFLRVNQQLSSRDDYLQRLADAEIDAIAARFAPQGIRLQKPLDVKTLPGFEEGAVSVQDEAAQLCCALMDLQPGFSVLDACAAPGGKTAAMLESEPQLGKMTALELEPKRAERIEENLQRLNLTAEIKIADAAKLDDWWDGAQFDRILLDAPCSASGVIRRHPDIKILRRETDIVPLAEIQMQLLQQLWSTLKTGGRLVYATCSVFPQENTRIIERFLRQQPDAKEQVFDAPWGTASLHGRQLFPTPEGHDGFYYACLEKR